MKTRVLQWNVWFRESAESILRELERFDADVLCLQELTSDSYANPGRNLPEEIAALGYSPIYRQTLDAPGTEYYKMGNGIFSKLPVLQSREVYVQHASPAGGYELENRIYVEARLETDSGPLTVGTVHLSYTHEFKTSTDKYAEADRLLEAITSHDTRFVLTGDMNASPDSYTIRALDKVLRPAGPPYGQPTWTTKPFAYNGFQADSLDWRLDYAFTTPDVRVVSSQMLQTDVSDHLPILLTLEV